MVRSDIEQTLAVFEANGRCYRFFSLDAAERAGFGRVSRLPVSLRVLFENLLRNHHQGRAVSLADIRALGGWLETRQAGEDIAYHPARIVMPDSSGIPLLADLAAMRDAMVDLGADPTRINPLSQVDIVVDHSAIVDVSGRSDAAERNLAIEYERNGERYEFLRWAQSAFTNIRIVPSGQGIIHQVNLEFLTEVVRLEGDDESLAIPDTVLGMDSHTPMINALGILGWGCGGIEGGAAMLGQPVSMRIPEVIGVRFTGALRPGVTATDLVLMVTERLRAAGVVQKFVEYCGPGLSRLSMASRATIANMAPEYGATVGFFPIDDETIAYLRSTGRSDERLALIEAYARAQGFWRGEEEPLFTEVIDIDLVDVEPSLAGPKSPQDRIPLAAAKRSVEASLAERPAGAAAARVPVAGRDYTLGHGDIAVAAITSCTNTSNPSVIVGAALLAQKAVALGLSVKPWVKTSFSPGSRAVAAYLNRAGLQPALDALGFQVAGFGCMTCMGNSGPLDESVTAAIETHGLAVAAILSGNRNFEGRVHTRCRLSYLASPPLVVAYAIAGTMQIDLTTEPLGIGRDGRSVYLRDVWPDDDEIARVIRSAITPDLYTSLYATAFEGDENWRRLPVRGGATFAWRDQSWYIRRPPFFARMSLEPTPLDDIRGARALAVFGDSITTDHISPIGVISPQSPAGTYLVENGIGPRDFNSYASRRVNHDVMVRGTFANERLQNEMSQGREGGVTRHMPDGGVLSIFDAALRYRRDSIPLIIVAGKAYGAGSSRDWAAKGTRLLGVRAVVAEGFERIHRANLIGMGIVPLQFQGGDSRHTLAIDGSEIFDLEGIQALRWGSQMRCRITRVDGSRNAVDLLCRIDTPHELEYLRQGGILPFMLRRLAA